MQIGTLTEQAEQFEESGSIREAIDRWRAAVAIERRPELLARLARLCARAGEVQEAEELLLESIRMEPDLSDPHFYLGVLYKTRGLLERAKECLERAVGLDEWGPSLVVLGEVYRRLDMPSEASRTFERATIVDSGNSEAWYGVGLLYREGDPARAIAAFRQSIILDPNHGAAHRELGALQMREKDFSSAERSVRTALRLDDGDAWAHDYLGNILLYSERAGEAADAFRRAIALWPDLPLFHNNLGDALRALRRISEAERVYMQALTLDISDYLANLRMGEILIEQGRVTSAETYLVRALQAKPNERRALAALERVRRQSRNNGIITEPDS